MISVPDLRKVARVRLRDARALWKAKRYDAAMYLAGYVVEIGLKARICRTLGWAGFPESPREFEGFTSLKTHKLDVLLRLSGREQAIRGRALAEWTRVIWWDPETRYRAGPDRTREEAKLMIVAAEEILRVL